VSIFAHLFVLNLTAFDPVENDISFETNYILEEVMLFTMYV
jgi:hypothetical protein